MDTLLAIGLLLITGYTAGWLANKLGIPRILGYIATGIAFSPNTSDFIDPEIIQTTQPLMEVCLAFIVFEVGGALRWSKIRKHKKEIISITALASIIPFIFIVAGFYLLAELIPSIIPFDAISLLMFTLLLGALASPTEPAATLAVMHQYVAKGKVSDTILGVAALDDVVGILLFSLTLSVIFMTMGKQSEIFGSPILNSIYEIAVAILLGIILGLIVDPLARLFQLGGEGQWVVIIFSLIIFCTGISRAMHVDALLSSITMGVIVANKSQNREVIFRLMERYTEDLIFLFFFLLSGLYLDISTFPQASALIFLFVLLRTLGKFSGVYAGAKIARADRLIQKYTAGGLLAQGGVVIGLVLSIYQNEQFKDISEVLLTTIMGAVVIHELIGPIATKYSLKRAGEITSEEDHS